MKMETEYDKRCRHRGQVYLMTAGAFMTAATAYSLSSIIIMLLAGCFLLVGLPMSLYCIIMGALDKRDQYFSDIDESYEER